MTMNVELTKVELTKNDTAEKLGRAIKKKRIDKGIRQQELAAKIGVTSSYLSQVERGRAPSYALLLKIADALEMKIGRLLLEAETDSRSDDASLLIQLAQLVDRGRELIKERR
jgi:putative transcriptional regulator